MVNFSSIGNFFRSLSYINRHTISLSKLKNRFKIMKEYSNGDLKVSSFPNMIHIEPTNHCNLQCVMCPQPRDMTRVKGTMELKMFKDIINELRNTPAEFVYLHQFGESLLVNDVYEMIDYAEDANIRAGMSTNAVALNEKNSKRLLNSKLSFLTLSLDGGKQEIYDKFRPGDSWERVEKNVFKFLDLRKKMTNEKSPFVVVQTISMKGNENSIQNLKNKFSDYNVIFSNKPFNDWGGKLDDINSLAIMDHSQDNKEIEKCEKPYKLLTIEWDGTVVPCTRFWDNQFTYGKFPEQTLREIWNSDKAQKFRAAHNKSRDGLSFCSTCSLDGPSPIESIGLRFLDIMFIEKLIAGIPLVRERKLTSFLEKFRGYRKKKLRP